MLARTIAHCLCRVVEVMVALATIQVAFYLTSVLS